MIKGFLLAQLTNLELFAIDCKSNPGFFGLPHWYRNIPRKEDAGGVSCSLKFDDLEDIWKIVFNVIEMITRLSAYIAVVMILVGGFMFIFGNGEPERIATARKTITYAVIGLVISIFATSIVAYISGLI